MQSEMVTVAVCEHMGWDYITYLAQPAWFIDLIIGKLEIDTKNANKKLEVSRR